MRKLLLSSTVALGALALGSTAYADVLIDASVVKEKDVLVEEDITVTKDITLTAELDIEVTKAAEAMALVNQSIDGNEACTNCAEKTDTIENSLNANTGIVTWNQASGNGSNQGNAVAASIDTGNGNNEDPNGGENSPGFADAQASGQQINGAFGDRASNTVESVNILFREAFMLNSGNGNSGILFANQSAGNFNNQANGLALALSLPEGEVSGVALAESDLGQWNVGNMVGESDSDLTNNGGDGINKLASINASLNNNTGIVGFNQSAGNLANQGNFFSAAYVQLAPAVDGGGSL